MVKNGIILLRQIVGASMRQTYTFSPPIPGEGPGVGGNHHDISPLSQGQG